MPRAYGSLELTSGNSHPANSSRNMGRDQPAPFPVLPAPPHFAIIITCHFGNAKKSLVVKMCFAILANRQTMIMLIGAIRLTAPKNTRKVRLSGECAKRLRGRKISEAVRMLICVIGMRTLKDAQNESVMRTPKGCAKREWVGNLPLHFQNLCRRFCRRLWLIFSPNSTMSPIFLFHNHILSLENRVCRPFFFDSLPKKSIFLCKLLILRKGSK